MVLAVAVAVGEHGIRRMRLDRAVAQEHGDVADMLGHPVVEPFRLLATVIGAGGDLVRQGLDPWGHRALRFGKRRVGAPDRLPTAGAGDHQPGQAVDRRNGGDVLRLGRQGAELPVVGQRGFVALFVTSAPTASICSGSDGGALMEMRTSSHASARVK